MTDPLVSICIPTYNRANVIRRAIDSALSQTYKNIEVIVVDNASTDNTEEIVASYTDPRLSYVRNSENLGMFGNLNRCIELYNGDYLHILHSDDFIDLDFTEKCVNFFKEHPDVWLTSTSSRVVSTNNEILKTIHYFDYDKQFDVPTGLKKLLSNRCFISCPSVMVHRGLYEDPDIGKFSLEFPYSSDYYQWLKVARKYIIGYVKNTYLNYTVSNFSESYKYLVGTPLGYLDTVNIHIKLISDLDSDVKSYYDEINSSLIRFIKDVLYAGFTRADNITNIRPLFFIGIAFIACSMLQTYSFRSSTQRFKYLLVVLAIYIPINIGFVRRSVGKHLMKGKQIY